MRKAQFAAVFSLAFFALAGGCLILAEGGFTTSSKRGHWSVFVPAPKACVMVDIMFRAVIVGCALAAAAGTRPAPGVADDRDGVRRHCFRTDHGIGALASLIVVWACARCLGAERNHRRGCPPTGGAFSHRCPCGCQHPGRAGWLPPEARPAMGHRPVTAYPTAQGVGQRRCSRQATSSASWRRRRQPP